MGPGPYKTLVSVYGGPHRDRVQELDPDRGHAGPAFQGEGLFVFAGQPRDSRRGLRFEGAVQHRMGAWRSRIRSVG